MAWTEKSKSALNECLELRLTLLVSRVSHQQTERTTPALAHNRPWSEGCWYLLLLFPRSPGPCPKIPEQQFMRGLCLQNCVGKSNTQAEVAEEGARLKLLMENGLQKVGDP